MHFIYPFFLFALFALAIPVFIHLFNFRKYKTEYFSNVQLLQDLLLKTKKESQLKHLIVLILRMLAITALVFAFAQPFIPNQNFHTQKGNLVTLFVDNSFSMNANSEKGTFLREASDAARKIVNEFSYNDDFLLITHDFSSRHARILNKDEILNELELIQISPKSNHFSNILKWNQNISTYSNKSTKVAYYISDFQKDQFEFTDLKQDTSTLSFLVPISNENINNVSIDSCWFLSPVFKKGYAVSLNVRIRNFSETEVVKLPVKLYINGLQKALSTVDVKPNSYADCQLNYPITELGFQSAYVEINDAPISFDDRFYLVYQITDNTSIVAISDKNQNRYLNALYGKDSLFSFIPMDINQINYDQLRTVNLVVLDQLKTISSGFQEEMYQFVMAGGTLMIFPSSELDIQSWNPFLSKLELPTYTNLETNPLKVNVLNLESIYFKGSLADDYKSFDMPTVSKYFKTSSQAVAEEHIMTMENGDRFLSTFRVGNGKVILSAVPLNDDFGNAHKNALFFVPLHNIALMSQMQTKLYYTIGVDEQIVIRKPIKNAEDVFKIKALQSSVEFIPEIKNFGNEVALYFHSQIENDGFYQILQDKDTIAVTAFNFNRRESNLDYYSEDELEKIADESNSKIELLDLKTKDFAKSVSEKLNGKPLWRWFILLSLLFFLGEVMVLRFWGKVTYKK